MAARIGTATITSSATTCTPGTIAGVYRPAGGGATKVAGGPSSARALRALRPNARAAPAARPRPRRPARALSRSASRWGPVQCLRALRPNARAAPAARPRPVGRLERSRARGARPVLARSSAVSGGDDRPLGPEPERRAREIDEALLVLEQLVGGRLGLGGGERRLQVLAAVPPELRHAVVGLLRAAALAQDGVERVVHGVQLHVAPDAERLRVPADERAVDLVPVPLELPAREGGQATEGEDELQHRKPPRASLERGSSSRLSGDTRPGSVVHMQLAQNPSPARRAGRPGAGHARGWWRRCPSRSRLGATFVHICVVPMSACPS